jgi:hypothetical protein
MNSTHDKHFVNLISLDETFSTWPISNSTNYATGKRFLQIADDHLSICFKKCASINGVK